MELRVYSGVSGEGIRLQGCRERAAMDCGFMKLCNPKGLGLGLESLTRNCRSAG